MAKTKTIDVIVTEMITFSETVSIEVTPDDDDDSVDRKARAKYMEVPLNEKMVSSEGLDLVYKMPDWDKPKPKRKGKK